jgi:hypothetical protein
MKKKLYIILIIIIILLNNINCFEEYKKINVYKIEPNLIKGYDFPQTSNFIKFSIVCTEMCLAKLIYSKDIDKFRNGKVFTPIKSSESSLSWNFELSNTEILKKSVSVGIY